MMAQQDDRKSARQAADSLVRSALSSPMEGVAQTANQADDQDQRLLELWIDAGELKYSDHYAALLGSPTWRERWVTFRSRFAIPKPRIVLPALSTLALAGATALFLVPHATRYEADDQARLVVLPDKSAIRLAPSSRINFQMADGKRLAHLYGSAQFSVTHDAEHPFLVQVGDTQVRVIGTRFTLSYRTPCTQLSVLSGAVAIQSSSMPKRLLHAGEATVSIDANHSPVACHGTVPGASAPRWSYVDAPLSTVIGDIARFHPAKIVIESPDLAKERVTMSFSIDEIDGVIDTIPKMTESERRTGADGTIYLYR